MGRPTRSTAAGRPALTAPKLLQGQISVLELAVTIFQRAQTMVPLPEMEDLALMRRGARAVSREAYFLGFLQRSILALEEVATALRNEIEDPAGEMHGSQLSELDFNAIEAAVQAVRDAHAGREERP